MNYVLATSRRWNEPLAQRLQKKTGHTFHLISNKEDLSMLRLQEIEPRYVFFPHWSYVIPAEIFNTYECVIFHMTDLPYGRGGSPLQNLILRGHSETKISALRCVQDMDAGPIYLKRHLLLEGAPSEIFLRTLSIIENMIKEIVIKELKPKPQKKAPILFHPRNPEESDQSQTNLRSLNDFFDFNRMSDAEGYPKLFLDSYKHKIELSRIQMEQNKLVGIFTIYRQQNIPENGGVKALLDRCYPEPPRDVYERMNQCYKPGDPFYTLEFEENIVGMVYCCRHSKGGHLENLALDPKFRGRKFADRLMKTFIQDIRPVITLTTRIPEFFKHYGFKEGGHLPDGSTFMLLINTNKH